jgi:hypothetical protein
MQLILQPTYSVGRCPKVESDPGYLRVNTSPRGGVGSDLCWTQPGSKKALSNLESNKLIRIFSITVLDIFECFYTIRHAPRSCVIFIFLTHITIRRRARRHAWPDAGHVFLCQSRAPNCLEVPVNIYIFINLFYLYVLMSTRKSVNNGFKAATQMHLGRVWSTKCGDFLHSEVFNVNCDLFDGLARQVMKRMYWVMVRYGIVCSSRVYGDHHEMP